MYTELFLIFFTLHATKAYAPWNYNGTTPSIENIIKGRCAEYQIINAANKIDSLSVTLNCTTDVWNSFTNVFAYTDPCKSELTEKDYQPLFDKIQNTKPLVDKAMFWSGTREIVHDFSYVNHDYYTLEDTFAGYIANELRWCGCHTCSDGIGHDFCNKSCSDQTSAYWGLASRSFAEKAAGTVYVMVNGTQSGSLTAYWRGTTFGKIELPTLGAKQQVKLLQILVINNVDQVAKEKCGEGTLVQMVDDAHKHNITNVKCEDDPRMVNAILCAKYPNAAECQEKESPWKDTSYALIAVASLFLVIILILLVITGKRRHQRL